VGLNTRGVRWPMARGYVAGSLPRRRFLLWVQIYDARPGMYVVGFRLLGQKTYFGGAEGLSLTREM
jgi:hypothetical protein